jgi:hypothetical protein
MPCVGAYSIDRVPIDKEAIWGMDASALRQLFGVPGPFVRAAVGRIKPAYTDSQVSLTGLSGDLRYGLMDRRIPYYTTVWDKWWALMGTGVHAVLEEYADEGTGEEHIVHVENGVEVRCRLDLLEDGVLTDYKLTSVWAGKDLNAAAARDDLLSVRGDYWDQLELYAAVLYLAKGIEVKQAELAMVYRDWSAKYLRTYRDMPRRQMELHQHPDLDLAACVKKLKNKVSMFKAYVNEVEEKLPDCVFTWGEDKKTKLPRKCSSPQGYCPFSKQCSTYQAKKAAKKWGGR